MVSEMSTDRALQRGGLRARRAVIVPLALLILLALVPVLTGSGGVMSLLVQVFAFGVFAMSYDLLIGYTRIISFGHAMFFGTGAYAVAICLSRSGGTTVSLLFGLAIAFAIAIALSLLVAFLSLRVRETYFAMITLAVGQVFSVLAGSQALRSLTQGNDGLTMTLPMWLGTDTSVYYFCLGCLAVVAVFLTRFVQSPVGDVLKGIRENESRAFALGHSVVRVKTLAFAVSGLVAALGGALFAIGQAFVSTTVYDVSTVSLNVLLMVIIGGMGTLYGGVLGAAILLCAETWLSNLAGSVPIFQNYLILFGILYIVIVRFMPKGILGSLKAWGGRRLWNR
ncbi:branched-chain amino acid ABC transporter permease [Alicyclobacillus sp. ALC3]|uniref:branched-chain amino acid ABC transporter permease n=1 Tax=Alicyclobacillus sp. ALC3 TaxID=2796143 RepID=UPI00237867BD|nr:branched-chain amino acid ABC transporter permease [Alicyclobacillus sp. ALC3]WDL98249.1 branched-chain amino acid ABC transporter permease [Alicyclobacillus sp. ALC3]